MIRAAAVPSASAVCAVGEIQTVALDDIVGIDPCNSRRPDGGEDIESLADSLTDPDSGVGQINPIVVRRSGNGLTVLAGGRRWKALRYASDALDRRQGVQVRVFTGSDEAARDYSLAENFFRVDPPELDQAEAFARLAETRSVNSIAVAFGRDPRFVRQRMRLNQLPQKAKQAWRDGILNAAAAQALAIGDPQDVEHLIDTRPELLSSPAAIRAALTNREASARSPAAIFVGEEAYIAAGGTVREDLFSDGVWFVDRDLLQRLEREKLENIASNIQLVEGWGRVIFTAANAPSVPPKLTPQENVRFHQLLASDCSDPIIGGEVAAKLANLERTAVLRAVARDDRHRYGLAVYLDTEGRLVVERGVFLPPSAAGTSPTSPGADVPSSAGPSVEGGDELSEELSDSAFAAEVAKATRPAPRGASTAAAAASRDAADMSHAARLVALRAASRGAAQVIARNEVLALRLLIGALTRSEPGESPIRIHRIHGLGPPPAREIVQLKNFDFVEAARRAFDLDAHAAVAALVATSLDFRGHEESVVAGALGLIRMFSDRDDLQAEIADAFDYSAYFRAAPRSVALAVLREVAGDGPEIDVSARSNEALAEDAADVCEQKSWLPALLRVR